MNSALKLAVIAVASSVVSAEGSNQKLLPLNEVMSAQVAQKTQEIAQKVKKMEVPASQFMGKDFDLKKLEPPKKENSTSTLASNKSAAAKPEKAAAPAQVHTQAPPAANSTTPQTLAVNSQINIAELKAQAEKAL